MQSDFVLIAGTNRDLGIGVREGRFREDLLARLDLWTFGCRDWRERREDIEPNLEFELRRFADQEGARVTFNKEALRTFVAFATSADAPWQNNFRDLSAAIARMATLAPSGRITETETTEEISRLISRWRDHPSSDDDGLLMDLLGDDRFETLDLFDRPQLAAVIRMCRASRSLSDAGRKLFQSSRLRRKSANDADRLRKYLGRYGLDWEECSNRM